MTKSNFPALRACSWFALSLMVGALGACGSLSSHYQRPSLELPATLNSPELASQATQIAPEWRKWWQILQDPALDALLAEAQANNQDLALAAARILEARATLVVTESGRYPTLDGALAANRSRSSTTTGKLSPTANPYAKDVQFGISAAWEVDFWNRHNNQDQAARARFLAQQGSRALVQSSLMASITERYCILRAQDAQLRLAESLLKTRQQNLHLQQQRFAAGVAGELELNAAKNELNASEASAIGLRQSVASSETALALLAGRAPAAINTPVIARGANIAQLAARLNVPADLPSNLLQRRPDIISAEQNLIAAHADLAQARSLYFPTIKLTSTLGRDSKSLSDLFNPGSVIWNLAGNLTQPLLRAGAIDAAVQGSEARRAQAQAQYVQSVQAAFRDVHEALGNLSANGQLQSASAARLATQQQSKRLAQLRFDQGYSSAPDLLNAERDHLQVQAGLVDSQRGHLQAMVALYKALGGGWE